MLWSSIISRSKPAQPIIGTTTASITPLPCRWHNLRLDPREYLVVVPNIHQNLRVALDGIVQYTERTGLEVRRFAGGGSVRHRCLCRLWRRGNCGGEYVRRMFFLGKCVYGKISLCAGLGRQNSKSRARQQQQIDDSRNSRPITLFFCPQAH